VTRQLEVVEELLMDPLGRNPHSRRNWGNLSRNL